MPARTGSPNPLSVLNTVITIDEDDAIDVLKNIIDEMMTP